VVEQQVKKCTIIELVLGCFFGLGFVASAGHVCKSAGKVWESAGKCRAVPCWIVREIKKGWK